MFNNTKSQEFFDPSTVQGQIHIIGCGAVGASISELLVRTGVEHLHIWDFDKVESHNLANQMFFDRHIGMYKTDALKDILKEINPDVAITKHEKCTTEDRLSGYIFLAIDNIDIRRELCEKWRTNPNIKFVQDGRMKLTDGTTYSAIWSDKQSREDLIQSMQYTHEEALKETPVSACGMTLSVVVTPRIMAALMVSNFIKFVNTSSIYKFTIIDGYKQFLETY